MSKHIDFDEQAWDDYLDWQTQDRKTFKKINELIRDILRNGYKGIGKPEKLKGELSGWCSRRIDDKHRFVYRVKDDVIEILSCKGHYND